MQHASRPGLAPCWAAPAHLQQAAAAGCCAAHLAALQTSNCRNRPAALHFCDYTPDGLTSELTQAQMEKDVEDMKEQLAQSLFDHIPVGVGSQGIIPTSAKDLEAALEMGMDWSLREVGGREPVVWSNQKD